MMASVHNIASFRAFRRSVLVLLISCVCLAAMVFIVAMHSDAQANVGSPPTSRQNFFTAQQTLWLRDHHRLLQKLDWQQGRASYAHTLGAARKTVGIERLEFQPYPDRHLWLLDDTPSSIHSNSVEISLRLHHGGQFLHWLDELGRRAPAFALQCRLERHQDAHKLTHTNVGADARAHATESNLETSKRAGNYANVGSASTGRQAGIADANGKAGVDDAKAGVDSAAGKAGVGDANGKAGVSSTAGKANAKILAWCDILWLTTQDQP